MLGSFVLKIFINKLDNGTEFTDNTKLGGSTNMPVGHAAIQRHHDRLEKQADKNFVRLRRKCKVLYLARKKLTSRVSAGGCSWKATSQQKLL